MMTAQPCAKRPETSIQNLDGQWEQAKEHTRVSSRFGTLLRRFPDNPVRVLRPRFSGRTPLDSRVLVPSRNQTPFSGDLEYPEGSELNLQSDVSGWLLSTPANKTVKTTPKMTEHKDKLMKQIMGLPLKPAQ
jgi:hypothetical protein